MNEAKKIHSHLTPTAQEIMDRHLPDPTALAAEIASTVDGPFTGPTAEIAALLAFGQRLAERIYGTSPEAYYRFCRELQDYTLCTLADDLPDALLQTLPIPGRRH